MTARYGENTRGVFRLLGKGAIRGVKALRITLELLISITASIFFALLFIVTIGGDNNKKARQPEPWFIRYIEVNNLAKWLRLKPGQTSLSLKNFAGFAHRYNGPAYKRFKYHTKMLSAYQKHSVDVSDQLAMLPRAAW